MQRLVVLIFVLTFATGVFAQGKHVRKRPSVATPQMQSVKQSEEMKKVTDTFAGQWKTMATIEKSSFFPYAGTSTGRSDFRSGPAGNSLIERTRSHGVMGEFAGTGTIWWDAKAAAYRGIWCDSISHDGCDPMGTGQWAGNSLVFTSQMDMGQSKIQVKDTYSDITADSFTFTMETGMDGAPMTTLMTIQYQRAEPRTTVITPPAGAQPQ
jgi:hypothetical protein